MDYLVRRLSPRLIILFGSCARGVATPNSDIDLCVVLEDRLDVKERVTLRSNLLPEILELTDFEVDLFLCGIQEWEEHKGNPGTLIGKISREGKVLCHRQPEL
ncbi:MAG TPA: nucleotidyltransferase domain-containing protein [Clostridia bacterium]|nr:nucleotidyltransferase domain-containing protein [Clostridia bacterium]